MREGEGERVRPGQKGSDSQVERGQVAQLAKEQRHRPCKKGETRPRV